MAPFTLNLTIYQGATFDKTVTWKSGSPATPVDLTGATARMQIRDEVDSDTTLLELTTVNGRLILGGALGTVRMLVSAADTALLDFQEEAVYDLEIVLAGGAVRRLLAGSVNLSLEVTR